MNLTDFKNETDREILMINNQKYCSDMRQQLYLQHHKTQFSPTCFFNRDINFLNPYLRISLEGCGESVSFAFRANSHMGL
jgi:hypothetical protein